ncbi:MAG: hypothetical protein U5M23_12860 [Marinagarivorans sp.]|nr:hypothetical protein [Marinagarivorans sp.]
MKKRILVTTAPLLLGVCTLFLGGCAGDTEDDTDGDNISLDRNFFTSLLSGDTEKNFATRQRLAQQLGNDVIGMMNNSNLLFTTLSSTSDTGSTTNKLLKIKPSSTPSGVELENVSTFCSGGGNFSFDLQLGLIYDDRPDATPIPESGIYAFTTAPAHIAFTFNYAQCNEPQRIYDDATKTYTAIPDQNRIMDGKLTIKLQSENKLGGVSNRNDFIMEGVVTLENFFHKTYLGSVEPDYLPNLVTGDISVVLRTRDVESNIYEFYTDMGITNSYSDKNGLVNGYNRLAVKLNGELVIDQFYHVLGYALNVGGSQRYVGLNSEGSYRLYTEEALVKTPSDTANNYPSSGRLRYTDTNTQLQHTVTATTTGLDFVIQQLDNTSKTGSCTWVQIENSECVIDQ